jgi:peroxiredoxin
MKNLVFIFSCLLLLSACKSSIKLEGKIENMPAQRFKIEELAIDSKVPIDSGKTDANGSFQVDIKSKEEALYRIVFEQGKYILIALQNGDNAKITGDWNQLENYQVAGSSSSAALKSFLVNLRENINDLRTMQVILDSLKVKPQGDSVRQEAEKDMRNINAGFMTYLKQFADTTQSVSSALFAVNMVNPAFEQPFIHNFYQNVGKRFPTSTTAKAFAEKYFGSIEQSQQSDINTGTPAPDFAANTPEGTSLSLQSLKGKYVLLDFWASWCGPCRKENPNVVKAFDQFKNENFEIIGVSLDTDKEKWNQAIQDDKLTWKHVSELKGWGSSIARNYNVESIPQNFLIDPQGNIIAKDLKGDNLIAKLNAIFPKTASGKLP